MKKGAGVYSLHGDSLNQGSLNGVSGVVRIL